MMVRRTLGGCALFLIVAGQVWAQSPNATADGQVLDQSGAVIAGASVELVNEATNIKYATTTNGDGIYVVSELSPGAYRIEVSHAGFKTVVKPDVIFNVRDALAINFRLSIGSINETVTVQAGASMINTTDASVSTVVDQTYIKNMPLNGRSFQDLILLTPGIVTQTPQNGGNSSLGMTGEFSVNGQRPESNNYTVDGVSANVGAAPGASMLLGAGASGSVAASTALGTTQALVSVDDLQEFRVQSSTYSAEYGRNPGGQFAFETKSGTNQWHGTAYDYVRNGFFDAADWFNDYFGLKEPALRQNDFGGTFGGPINVPRVYNGKSKSFFFGSYEGLRLAAPQPARPNFVPDIALRASTSSPLALALNAFPLPSVNGIDDTANGIGEYIASWSNPASLNSTSIRLDHLINDKSRLFFRFSETTSSSTTRGTSLGIASPTSVETTTYTTRTYTGGATSAFSTRVANDFRFNYSFNGTADGIVIGALGGSTPVDLVKLSALDAGSAAAVILGYGGYDLTLLQRNQSSAQKQWNLVDTASLTLGRHQFKFGADYRRLSPFAILSPASVNYIYGSKSQVQTNSGGTDAFAFAPSYPLFKNFSAFAQDQWTLSQRLSLSLGLRWEVNPAPGVTQGLNAYTVQGSGPDTWTLAPQGTPLWHTTWYNFAPRLGMAYTIHSSAGWETVLRGGGGVFFDTGQQLASGGFFDGPGFSASTGLVPGSFPVSAGATPVIVNPPVPPYSPWGFASHLQLPYTLQWNASLQQGLGNLQAVTVSYVGSHAARLLQENVYFPPNNPNASFVTFVQNGLTSDYDSAQVQFQRRLSRGLAVLASYTWSHCIDYGSQNYTIGYQRGDCNFDVRHNFSAALSFDLPNLVHGSFASAILRDWGIDTRFTARTAFPVTLAGFGLVQSNGQFYDEGLNFVPGQPVYLHGSDCASVLQSLGDLNPGQGCPGGKALNPSAFVDVSSGFGDAPRNFARLFGAWQMDFAVRREFPLREGVGLQFRAEAFNIFNHPNFGAVDGQFGDITFGQATGTLASSLGVLSPLYQMGGPRSMQFALKLVF
jgi:hypothetical protein